MTSAQLLYLDDLAVGDTFTTDSCTITEEEIIAFAQKYDPQPFHTDPDAASNSFFAGLAASGWHTGAITMNLIVRSGLPFAEGIIGMGAELSWPTATRPGDVLHVASTIAEITPSKSKPDRGVVTVYSETVTANGEIRQKFTAKLLSFRRPTANG